jgi:hypothetical protein
VSSDPWLAFNSVARSSPLQASNFRAWLRPIFIFLGTTVFGARGSVLTAVFGSGAVLSAGPVLLLGQSRRPHASSVCSSVLFALFWSESISIVVSLIFVLVVFVLRAQAAPSLGPLTDSEKFIFATILIDEDSRWWNPILFFGLGSKARVFLDSRSASMVDSWSCM